MYTYIEGGIDMELQDKVVLNIIGYMDKLNIEIKDNKVKSYVEYLSKKSDLSLNRLNNILDVNKKRKIRLDEVCKIADALNVDTYILFKVE